MLAWPVQVGLVVPSWGYAHFLNEMMASILGQTGEVGFRVVLNDDADPNPESAALCRTYAEAHPELIHYIRPRQNGGLSLARNQGAEYILGAWPSVEVIMFTDADDRMAPDFVANSHRAFCRARAETEARGEKLGWVFEHPNIVGMDGRMIRLSRHSVLWNMVGATQMPSSALSAEMFREGLRYNETMRNGGEDWRFSLDALERGFVARHCEHQGFLWRRRPGSMSSQAAGRLTFENNRTRIRRSHMGMFSGPKVLERYRAENAHFARITPGGLAYATSVPELFAPDVAETSPDDLAARLRNNASVPADPCPEIVAFVARGVPRGLLNSELRSFFSLVSEFFPGKGQTVFHSFVAAPPDAAGAQLADVRRERPAAGHIALMSRATLLAHLRHGRDSPIKHGDDPLHFVWQVPEAAEPGPEVPRCDAVFAAWIDRADAGARDFQQAARYKQQAWRPQNLSWHDLPRFHTGVTSISVQPPDGPRAAILLEPHEVRQASDWCRAGLEGEPVTFVVIGLSTPETTAQIEAARQAGTNIDQVVYSDQLQDLGPSKSHWVTEPLTMLLGGFRRVVYWSTLEFSEVLGQMRALGVRRELTLKGGAALVATLARKSSVFKAFDLYRVVDADAGSISTLVAFGIARENVQIDYVNRPE